MSKKIESCADSILKKFGITEAPVPIEKLALKMDLAVTPTDLGPGVSGALVINGSSATIGVNINESRVRRRFTIAHELGHYFLHKQSNTFFVETTVLFRDGDSSSGNMKQERDANKFAAYLLMPEPFLEKEIKDAKETESLTNDDEIIGYLAKKFDVSEIAMTYRLLNLKKI
jgi:Zn-dependent peptidase ImmA (M78 family)